MKKPEDLDDVAAAKWRQTVALLHGCGVWSDRIADIVELYARTWSAFVTSQRHVDDHGIALETEDSDGNRVLKRNPVDVALHRYRDALLRMEATLGLTPVAKDPPAGNGTPDEGQPADGRPAALRLKIG